MSVPGDAVFSCPTCWTPIRGSGDRFCRACGTRLMRPDLRDDATAAPWAAASSPPAGPPGAWMIPVAPMAAPSPVRRNETAVVAMVLVALALIGGAVVTLVAVTSGQSAAPSQARPDLELTGTTAAP